MAIGLEKPLESGVVANYHRILRVANVDYRKSPPTALVEVGSYLDQTTRDDGKTPVMVYTFEIEGEALNTTTNLREAVYTLLSQEGGEYEAGVVV